jgi:hypothetical protein
MFHFASGRPLAAAWDRLPNAAAAVPEMPSRPWHAPPRRSLDICSRTLVLKPLLLLQS